MNLNLTFPPGDATSLTTEFYHGQNPNGMEPVKYSKTDVVLKVATLVIIILLAVIGNSFVIYTISRSRRLHRPPFYYLISLSVADLSRAVFCLPFVMASVLEGHVWKHGDTSCMLLAFANAFFVYSSIMALLAIAIDRHLAVVHTKLHKRRSRGLMNLSVVLIGWVIAFAMSFPPVLGIGSYTYIPEEAQCTFKHKRYSNNNTLGYLFMFASLLVVTDILYCRVFIFLRNHRKMRPLTHPPARSSNWTFFGPGANGQAVINLLNGFAAGPPNPMINTVQNLPPQFGRIVNLQTVRNEHLTRLFFVVTIVIDVLWIPYMIKSFWQTFGYSQNIPSLLSTVAAWLSYFQVASCPLVYVCCNSPFRKAIRANVNAYYKRGIVTLE